MLSPGTTSFEGVLLFGGLVLFSGGFGVSFPGVLFSGLTVIFVLLKVPLGSSVQFTLATFSNVPSVKTLTTTHTEVSLPLFSLPTFQVTL